jgi:ATP-dependent 26S proteasome regulatory subunit
VDNESIRGLARALQSRVHFCDFSEEEDNDDLPLRHLVQWTSGDQKSFIPSTYSIPLLPAGLYELASAMNVGTFFQAIQVASEGLIEFPETNSKKVVEEIENFWKQEKTYKKCGLAYKRGILLYGPAGGGKTCTIKLSIDKIIKMDGIVIKFTEPNIFMDGIRKFREIEPHRPCIVIMEDLDSIIDNNTESQVVNILDGIDMVQNIVFLATTNYPEKLSQRILNRPSRFDRRFKIGMPSEQSRQIYIKHLQKSNPGKKINLDKWVKDTDGFSMAHLKELFVSVAIFGYPYDVALEELRSMKKEISSEDDNRMGLSE